MTAPTRCPCGYEFTYSTKPQCTQCTGCSITCEFCWTASHSFKCPECNKEIYKGEDINGNEIVVYDGTSTEEARVSDVKEDATYKGKTACKGVATGNPLFLSADFFSNRDKVEELQQSKEGGRILIMPMTTPDVVPILDKVVGIATEMGGMLCHAAIIAREYNIPTVVGCGSLPTYVLSSKKVTVDGDKGEVIYHA